MTIKIQDIWRTEAAGLTSPELAQRHLKALEAETKPVEPVVHCDYYNGLINGVSNDADDALGTVIRLLEKLEEAGRKIVLLTHISNPSEKEFREIFPDRPSWKIKEKLKTSSEFWDRARLRSIDTPKAELLITRRTEDDADMDYMAHVSVFNPDALNA